MNNLKIYVRAIAIPVLVGIIVGLITGPSMDYSMLQKPFLAPPGWLFPIVWTILYILMGVSYGILETNNLIDENTNRIYYAQLAVNALWSIFFFTLEWRLFAFIWIILLAILIILMIKEFYNKNKVAGLLQIPYILWVAFATYLNLSFYLLNR